MHKDMTNAAMQLITIGIEKKGGTVDQADGEFGMELEVNGCLSIALHDDGLFHLHSLEKTGDAEAKATPICTLSSMAADDLFNRIDWATFGQGNLKDLKEE